MGTLHGFRLAATLVIWLGVQCHSAAAEERLMFKAGISDPVNTVPPNIEISRQGAENILAQFPGGSQKVRTASM